MTLGDEELLTDLIESYIAHLEGDGETPDLSELDPATRQSVEGVFRTVLAAWRSDVEVPPSSTSPSDSDGSSSALSTDVLLDGDKLRRARTQRRLSPSEVDQRLNATGHSVGANWTARAERNPTSASPTLAAALASILGVGAGELGAASGSLNGFRRWLDSDDFDQQARVWFEQERLAYSTETVRHARSQLALAHQRSSGGSREQWISMLHAVLEQLR
jgi:hypothetical protein